MAGEQCVIFCVWCGHPTQHLLRGSYSFPEFDEREGEWHPIFDTVNLLWSCAGCGVATLEVAWDGPGGRELYPPRTAEHRKVKFFHHLPPRVNGIYRETIAAFNHGHRVLCAAGIRAAIEGVCEDKGMGPGNLEARIDQLQRVLPANLVANLHSFRFMGNDAVHRLDPPDVTALSLAMDVLEDLLNFLYELDYKASRLNAVVTRRRAPRNPGEGAPNASDGAEAGF